MKHLLGAVLTVLCALPLLAGTITLDMNGFANLAGGQVTGPGLEQPIKMEPKADKVVLANLQADQTYGVDFFHNSGKQSSDFLFTMNAAGTGVESVKFAEGIDTLLDGFTAGQNVLKLKTHKVVFNANSGLTSVYFIQGAIQPYALAADKGPQELTLVPGYYAVDNLNNTGGGNEDFAFFVDAKGQAGPIDSAYPISKDEMRVRDANEYATFEKNAVSPRATKVKIHIEASVPVNFHPTGKIGEVTRNEGVMDFEMTMTVGAGGLNVWSFGKYEVTGGDVTLFDGKPAMGVKGENDYHFYPVLRYDLKKQAFYFETLHGPDITVVGEAKGFIDGNVDPLTVKVTATIVPEPKPEIKEVKPTAAPGIMVN